MTYYTIDDLQGILELLERTPSGTLESESIEFKDYANGRALYESKELAEEVSALANKNGGVIVIGVRDSKHIQDVDLRSQLVGAPEIDAVELKERLLGRLTPKIDVRV